MSGSRLRSLGFERFVAIFETCGQHYVTVSKHQDSDFVEFLLNAW